MFSFIGFIVLLYCEYDVNKTNKYTRSPYAMYNRAVFSRYYFIDFRSCFRSKQNQLWTELKSQVWTVLTSWRTRCCHHLWSSTACCQRSRGECWKISRCERTCLEAKCRSRRRRVSFAVQWHCAVPDAHRAIFVADTSSTLHSKHNIMFITFAK